MKNRKSLWISAIAAFGLPAASYAAPDSPGAKPGRDPVISTPAGITLQPLGLAQGYRRDKESATLLPRDEVVYADARGMTLYTYAQDPAGKSTCVADCAKTWPPALAQAGAAPFGAWSLIARDDGTKQWALEGKPLYTFVKDVDIGSMGGNSPKRYGRGKDIGERGQLLADIPEDVPMPEGWKAALFYPSPLKTLPPGFTVREVDDAAGLVLVYERGRTTYAFSGDPNKDGCNAACAWRPVQAPQLAAQIGSFSSVPRADGVRQWTYNGRALYTFSNDLSPGDSNGAGIDKRWNVAYIARNFMPASVVIQETGQLGKVLATAQGRTLYRRDAYILQSGSGHSLRRGNPVRPAVGRDLGTEPHCVRECDRWHPFAAPADAQGQGYWNVATRSDGSKQWVYQGYSLWTYDGDTKPGDITANDSYELALQSDGTTAADIGTPYDAATALYWAAAIP